MEEATYVHITAGREINLLENTRSADKIKIEGIAGAVGHSGEVGDRKVGARHQYRGVKYREIGEGICHRLCDLVGQWSH
jgi:hypothetical protein